MGTNRKRLVSIAASMVIAVSLAGCGGDGGDDDGARSSKAPSRIARTRPRVGRSTHSRRPSPSTSTRSACTLAATWPTRAGWSTAAGLNFPLGDTDAVTGQTPIPDLATDAGQSNEDATEWSFTLKDPAPVWQDGQPITCEDFKYGVSRTFATDVITGGPPYILGFLDVPEAADGSPAYKGPYTGEGQAEFDKAVTCDGNTITYRFKKPWPDFPYAVASLRSFDPYRADKDQGDKSDLQVFSNGPVHARR